MSLLQVKAINGITKRLYTAGDQYHLENRVPEVGSNATFEDGREFVFCSTDANIAVGTAVGSAASNAELLAFSAAVASGKTEVSFVLAGVAADDYKGGYLTVTLGTGLGYTYKIKGNAASATVDAVANTVVMELEEELAVGVAATDNFVIKKARTAGVKVTVTTDDPVGIAQTTTTASTDGKTQYFWAQTSGISIGLGTVGAANVALYATTGGFLAADDGTNNVVATGIVAGASHSMVNLCFPKA